MPRRIKIRTLLAVAFALGGGPAAQAAITVATTPQSGPTFLLTPIGSKWRITLNTNVTVSPTTFTIRAAAADQIEQINVNSTTTQSVFIDVSGSGGAGTPVASVDSVNIGASTGTVVLQQLRTAGNVGSIRVHVVTDMNVGGDLTGDLVLLQRAGGAQSNLIGGTVTGRVRGNILVDHGSITSFTALGGIGAPSAPVQVRCRDNLVRLVAREIYADVSSLANGGVGFMGWVQTTGGPFVGSLATAGIAQLSPSEPGALIITGDLDANVRVLGPVRNQNGGQPVVNISGRFMPGRVFRVATSLEAGAQFRVGNAAGLQGQVIINGQNTTGVWSGPVTVAGNTLSPVPEYTSPLATVGGGAVGLVPFKLHPTDSWPPRASFLGTASAPKPGTPIRLCFYGPVNWSGAGAPVIVESRAAGTADPWLDQTACYTIGREPGANPSPNVVAIYPSRALPGGRTYRVRPVRTGPGMLFCDLALATNPAVSDFTAEQSFTISGDCAGDITSDGVVNFADISALLAAWGSPASSCPSTADVTADGVISFADVTAVLVNWNALCP